MLLALFVACVSGWLTILCLSIYAHRAASHRALALHPVVSHFMRFWLWLTTGASTRAWVAVHRKHHALVDREGDPHSPIVYGLANIFFFGYFYYRRETKNAETLERFGKDCPDDWVERNVYVPLHLVGLGILLAVDMLVFGWAAGLVAFGVQMVWEALWAAGVINGLGHTVGYRNYESRDSSRNIVPIGLLVSGEELHNNHHRFPRSAKFAARWFEVDLGWWVIRGLAALGLAKDLYVFDRPLDEHRALRAESKMNALFARWREQVARLQERHGANLARTRRKLERMRERLTRRLERRVARFGSDARARLEKIREEILREIKAAFAQLGRPEPEPETT